MAEDYQSKDLHALVMDYYDPNKRTDYPTILKTIRSKFDPEDAIKALNQFYEVREMLGLKTKIGVRRGTRTVSGDDFEFFLKPTTTPKS